MVEQIVLDLFVDELHYIFSVDWGCLRLFLNKEFLWGRLVGPAHHVVTSNMCYVELHAFRFLPNKTRKREKCTFNPFLIVK